MLIGISCRHKDYRLCHELNSALETKLERQSDLPITDSKTMRQFQISCFRYESETYDQYFLLSNRSEGGWLIPGQKQIDYFLIICQNMQKTSEPELMNLVKSVKVV